MPHSSDDVRKKFILTTTGNFFGLKPSSSLANSPVLNNFLDDGNEFVLSVCKYENDLQLSNKVIQLNTLFKATYQYYERIRLLCFFSYGSLCRLKDWGTAEKKCWCSLSYNPLSSQKRISTRAFLCHPCWILPLTHCTRQSNRSLSPCC